jgi:shikimate dehydrogenase
MTHLRPAALPAGTIALIGDPVAHSVSPVMHRAAFRATGLDLEYVAVRVRSDELSAAWPSLLDRFTGLNVTTPLKEKVLPLVDELSAEAARAGSVNTVVRRDGLAVGCSTDGTGFMAALARAGNAAPHRALVLGTGGAARAVAAALLDSGASVTVAGRNVRAGEALAGTIAVASFVRAEPASVVALLEEADLVVNATPLGGLLHVGSSPLPADAPLHPGMAVFDLVYRPRRTLLLRRAASAGCTTIPGIEMLIEQGVRSFELWTGLPAPARVMRTVAYQAVAADPAPPPRPAARSSVEVTS